MPAAQPKSEQKPLLPPDEKFWVRYSPHHEAPLSGMTSLFLHAAVVGLLLFVGFLANLRWHGDAQKPPNMTVVMLEGGGGLEGSGGPEGLPNGGKTELPSPSPEPAKLDSPEFSLQDVPSIEIFLPAPDPKTLEKKDLSAQLDDLAKQAALQQTQKNTGPNNPKGVGGKGGIGAKPGPGTGLKGTGPGPGGVGGPASKQQILAWRWRFDLTGDGKIHADKLALVGVTLAALDPRGDYWVIRDLKQRPVQPAKEKLDKYKDAVKWYNTKQESLLALARELQLPFQPQHVVLLLPKEREEKMASEEARFAKNTRRDLKLVQATWFDFRVRGESFEPVVLRME